MPELPEVETVRRGLEPAMAGQVIEKADIRRPDLRFPFPPNMAARLTGARVERLRRRSKYILADLSTAKHDHVVLDMGNGARITFNDARRFGAMDLFATATAATHPLLASLGPEPLGNDFSEPYLIARLQGRATPIKSALLDQSIVAGLGNIYVCEVLHRAGINPQRLAGQLDAKEVAALVPLIRQVLGEAIEAGGSSLRDYRQTDGELGYFQHTFRVYDREGQPCPTPGCTGTIARVAQSGRSSYYCPTCQR